MLRAGGLGASPHYSESIVQVHTRVSLTHGEVLAVHLLKISMPEVFSLDSESPQIPTIVDDCFGIFITFVYCKLSTENNGISG